MNIFLGHIVVFLGYGNRVSWLWELFSWSYSFHFVARCFGWSRFERLVHVLRRYSTLTGLVTVSLLQHAPAERPFRWEH